MKKGWLEVLAPALPLYAEFRHLVQDGTGFAGQMYAGEDGMRIKLDAEVIRVRTRLPAERWELRLRDRRGNPAPHITLAEWIRITGCAANDGPLGKSNGAGRLRVIVQPQEIDRLALEAESGVRRFLTETELATLMREKSITLGMASVCSLSPRRLGTFTNRQALRFGVGGLGFQVRQACRSAALSGNPMRVSFGPGSAALADCSNARWRNGGPSSRPFSRPLSFTKSSPTATFVASAAARSKNGDGPSLSRVETPAAMFSRMLAVPDKGRDQGCD